MYNVHMSKCNLFTKKILLHIPASCFMTIFAPIALVDIRSAMGFKNNFLTAYFCY